MKKFITKITINIPKNTSNEIKEEIEKLITNSMYSNKLPDLSEFGVKIEDVKFIGEE